MSDRDNHGRWMVLRWAAVLVVACWASTAGAMEAYFVAVFSYQEQDGINSASLSHSFAVFARVCGEGDRLGQYRIEVFTISWMPRQLDVHVYRLLPECGVNLDLASTLAMAHEHGLGVSMWGPYQIEQCLYQRALAQKQHLESGCVRYKALDTGFPTERVTNCVHAVSDIAIHAPRLRIGTPTYGDAASYLITQVFAEWIVDPNSIHDWLLEPLGLCCQPMIRRDFFTNPTHNPVRRSFQSLVNWHVKKHVR